MTTKVTRLSLSVIGGLVLASGLVRGGGQQPMAVIDLTGTLHIQQSVPCADDVDQTTPVDGGRLELTPSEGVPVAGGGRLFTLTRGNVSFAPFEIRRSCFGIIETRTHTETRVELVRAVSFTASPTPTPDEFTFVIPKEQFQFYYVTIVNGTREIAYKSPREDVTGIINLAAATMRMRAVFTTRVHYKVCLSSGECVIDEVRFGTLTTDLAGRLVFPDADRDGVPDRSDNCRFVANADQSPVATPLVVPPRDVTLTSCLDRGFGFPFAADRCDGGPVSVTSDAPAIFNIGPTIVTWTARDATGRTASATQMVTIVDTPPAVSCVAVNPPGSSFRVSAAESCGPSPVIRLGSFVLAEGETIMINETGRPGVRLRNVLGPGGIRHFQVGPGEAVVTATDASGHVGLATCAVPK